MRNYSQHSTLLAVLYKNAYFYSYENGFTDPEAIYILFSYKQNLVTNLNYQVGFPKHLYWTFCDIYLVESRHIPIYHAANLEAQGVCWSHIQQPQLFSRLDLT